MSAPLKMDKDLLARKLFVQAPGNLPMTYQIIDIPNMHHFGTP